MPQFQPTINLGKGGVSIDTRAAYSAIGDAVSIGGDIDGDGFNDLLISATDTTIGVPFVVYGRQTFPDLLTVPGIARNHVSEIHAPAPSETTGASVSSGGDVNGDGLDDLIISAEFADTASFTNAGRAYVVYGRTGGFGEVFELSTLDGGNGFIIEGAAASQYVSSGGVVIGGDVNGDGFDDVLVANAKFGSLFVVFGAASRAEASLAVDGLDGANGFAITGLTPRTSFQNSLNSLAATDFNGDGLADIVVSDILADGPGGTDSGRAFVIFGSTAPRPAALDVSALDGTNGFVIHGEAANDRFGNAARAGDVNGDGLEDFVFSAPGNAATGSFSGKAYVVFGTAEGLGAEIDAGDLDGDNGFAIIGFDPFEGADNAVGAGDVNGDGFADIVLEGYADRRFADAYVIFGGTGIGPAFDVRTIDGNNGFRIRGHIDLYSTGLTTGEAGDINGDGFSDFALGYPYRATEHGAAGYVVFGHRPDEAVSITGTGIGLTHNGGVGADVIDGLGGADKLIGWEGRDNLRGGGGRDIILGGNGGDRMTGGTGGDLLDGGNGKDVFIYTSVRQSFEGRQTMDRIEGFTPGLVDAIDLSAIDAVPGVPSDQGFAFIGEAAFSGAGQLRVVQGDGGTRIEGNVRRSDGAELVIWLAGVDATTLGAVDFVL